nr:bifunctional monodehydroascorbate reductase and carbonic anhydrase nectarin-3 [Tanacetum cinerariifolium]
MMKKKKKKKQKLNSSFTGNVEGTLISSIFEVTGDVFSSVAKQTSPTPELVNAIPNQATTGSLQPTSPNAIGSNLNRASFVPNIDKVAAIFGVSITSLKDIDVLTRCIEAGDCDDVLLRLNKDERKAAMGAILALFEKFLAARCSRKMVLVSLLLKMVSHLCLILILALCALILKEGRSSFAWCMIEVNVGNVLKDSINMGILLFDGSRFYKKMVRVNDGFQTVVNKRWSGKIGSINNNRSGVNVGKATWQPIDPKEAKANAKLIQALNNRWLKLYRPKDQQNN